MKNSELIMAINKHLISFPNFQYSNCAEKYLHKLKEHDPNVLVQMHNGECEYEGVYAPNSGDNPPDMKRAKFFEEGQSYPDDEDWIRVG